MTSNKETIFAALYSRMAGVAGILTTGRRVKHFDEVPVLEQPALFVEQLSVVGLAEGNNPSKQTVKASVLLYAFDDSDTGPMPTINGLVTQVEGLLRRQTGEANNGWTTTLGGNVVSTKITSVEYSGGNTSAQGIAVVTVEMMTIS